MAEGGELPLINRQITRLGAAISQDNMESFARGYLDLNNATIKNMKSGMSGEAFNREVIDRWKNKNPKNQLTVNVFIPNNRVSGCLLNTCLIVQDDV